MNTLIRDVYKLKIGQGILFFYMVISLIIITIQLIMIINLSNKVEQPVKWAPPEVSIIPDNDIKQSKEDMEYFKDMKIPNISK